MNQASLLHPDRALDTVLEGIVPLETETLRLMEALGRVLAEDVAAREDIPVADHAAMDGYALVASDTAGANREHPVSLPVVEMVTAGLVARQTVEPGRAIRIMTGAPIPEGADAVLPWEVTVEGDSGKTVAVLEPARPGAHIVRRGSDIRRGEVALRAGTRLRAQEIGVLASLGHPHVQVHRRPRVLVLATGDELIRPEDPLVPGKVRSSNTYTLLCQSQLAGGLAVDLGLGVDRPAEIARRIQSGFPADVVITSGGSAQGVHDYTEDVFRRLGATIAFHRVAIKPGKPVLFARRDRTMFFGLPGNPVASMVSFDLFVRPALLRLQGLTAIHRPRVMAILAESLAHEPLKRTFMRGRLVRTERGLEVHTTGQQGSGLLTSMVKAHGLIVLDMGQERYEAGTQVPVILFDHPEVDGTVGAGPGRSVATSRPGSP